MNSIPRRHKTFIVSFAAGILMISLACNMPFLRTEPGLSPQELQSTLQALEESWPTEFVLAGDGNGQESEIPFNGLATATSVGIQITNTPIQPENLSPPVDRAPQGMVSYFAQSGDTLEALSARFDVQPDEILFSEPDKWETSNYSMLVPPGQLLYIPDNIGKTLSSSAILPDSEIVYSPSTIGFNVEDAVNHFSGFLSTYQEKVNNELLSGPEIVQRIADLTSTNPRFLLALLEFRSGWVLGDPDTSYDIEQPIGFNIPDQKGLYKELSIAANQLNTGYYGWRVGSLTSLKFPDDTAVRLSPSLNAGSVAVQRLFSFFYRPGNWETALYGSTYGSGFAQLYTEMFGDPWERAAVVEPLLPANIAQPDLELPFLPGNRWALTGGPHYTWNAGSPRGALDFSPVTGKSGCYISPLWSTASADGVITRDGEGILMLDLDGDGYEQTGWVLLYLHLAENGRTPVGTRVVKDDPLGQPSCEGGITTGTHLHLARKYNGEWLAADGPLPFVLGGWYAIAGGKNYAGSLEKDGLVISANSGGKSTSIIQR